MALGKKNGKYVFLAMRSSKGGSGKSEEFVIYSIKTTVPTYLNRVYIQLYLHAQLFFQTRSASEGKGFVGYSFSTNSSLIPLIFG